MIRWSDLEGAVYASIYRDRITQPIIDLVSVAA